MGLVAGLEAAIAARTSAVRKAASADQSEHFPAQLQAHLTTLGPALATAS